MKPDHPDLPTKPRIPKYLHVIPVNAEKVQFYMAGRTVVMNGRLVATILPRLLELLDGSRTIAEILEEFRHDERDWAMAVLRQMQAKGLLEEAAVSPGASLPKAEAERLAAQLAFFSRFLHEPQTAQIALRQSRVHVLGIDSMVWHVAVDLAAAGVGHLHIIDPWDVEPRDCISGGGWKTDDIGRARSAVLADYLQEHFPQATVHHGREIPSDVRTARRLLSESDLVILCLEKPDHSMCRWVNQACVERGIPWVAAYLSAVEAVIGPMVVPGETACYECYHLRRQSNQDRLEERQTVEQYLEQHRAERSPFGQLSPLPSIAGGLVSLEALRQLAGFAQPSTYDAFLRVDLITLEAELHPILKLPRCPICGPLRRSPLVGLWSEELKHERHSGRVWRDL